MDENATFEADGTTINLGKVTSFENAGPPAAGGTPAHALNVYLTDGSTVPVRGEQVVQDFITALDWDLEPEGE